MLVRITKVEIYLPKQISSLILTAFNTFQIGLLKGLGDSLNTMTEVPKSLQNVCLAKTLTVITLPVWNPSKKVRVPLKSVLSFESSKFLI